MKIGSSGTATILVVLTSEDIKQRDDFCPSRDASSGRRLDPITGSTGAPNCVPVPDQNVSYRKMKYARDLNELMLYVTDAKELMGPPLSLKTELRRN